MNTSDTHQLEKSAPQGQQAAGKRKDTDYGDGLDLSKKATPTREQTPSQTSSNQNDPMQNLEQQQQQQRNLEGNPNKCRLLVGNSVGYLAMEQATSDLPVASTSAQSQQKTIKEAIKGIQGEEDTKTRLDDLKDDILRLIFAKLDTVDRYRGELVSKRWNRLIRSVWLSEKRLTDLQCIFWLYRGPKFTLAFLTRLLGKCPNLRTLSLEGVASYLWSTTALQMIADACPLLEVVNLSGFPIVTDEGLRLLGERCAHLRELILERSSRFTDEGIRTFLEVGNSAASRNNLAKGLEALGLCYCRNITGQGMFPKALSACPRGLKILRVTGMSPPQSRIYASDLLRDLINLRAQDDNPSQSENVAFPLTHLSLDGVMSDTLTLVADHFADTLIALDLQRQYISHSEELLIHGIEKVERIKSLQCLRLACPPLAGLTNSTLKRILLKLQSLRVVVISCEIPPAPPDMEEIPQIEALPEGGPIPVVDEQDEPAEPEEAPEVIGDEGVAPISLGLCSPFLEVISLPKSQVSGAALRNFTWLERLRKLSFAGSSQLDDASLIAFFQETASISSFSEFDLDDCSSLTGDGVWGALQAFRARSPPECKDLLSLFWKHERLISHRATTRKDVSFLEHGHRRPLKTRRFR